MGVSETAGQNGIALGTERTGGRLDGQIRLCMADAGDYGRFDASFLRDSLNRPAAEKHRQIFQLLRWIYNHLQPVFISRAWLDDFMEPQYTDSFKRFYARGTVMSVFLHRYRHQPCQAQLVYRYSHPVDTKQ